MYSMKPVFEIQTTYTHTSSMYKLKNLQLGTFRTYLDSKTEGIASENSLLENDEKMVLSRQEKLLSELSKLKAQLDTFRSEVQRLQSSVCKTVKPAKVLAPVTSGKVDYKKLLSDPTVQDVVINANPSNPPYSLLGLLKIWPDLPVDISVHVHSSVVTVPERLESRNFETKSRTPEHVNVTLVWKNVDDCQLVTSPIKNKIVLGEVNLLRFFYNYVVENDSVTLRNRIDDILDVAHLLNYASGQEKGVLLKNLSSLLDTNEWFTELGKPTIADISVWSVLVKSSKKDKLPQNIAKWLQKCSSFVGVQI